MEDKEFVNPQSGEVYKKKEKPFWKEWRFWVYSIIAVLLFIVSVSSMTTACHAIKAGVGQESKDVAPSSLKMAPRRVGEVWNGFYSANYPIATGNRVNGWIMNFSSYDVYAIGVNTENAPVHLSKGDPASSANTGNKYQAPYPGRWSFRQYGYFGAASDHVWLDLYIDGAFDRVVKLEPDSVLDADLPTYSIDTYTHYAWFFNHDAYENGYNAGHSAGYTDGYQEATEDYQTGIAFTSYGIYPNAPLTLVADEVIGNFSYMYLFDYATSTYDEHNVYALFTINAQTGVYNGYIVDRDNNPTSTLSETIGSFSNQASADVVITAEKDMYFNLYTGYITSFRNRGEADLKVFWFSGGSSGTALQNYSDGYDAGYVDGDSAGFNRGYAVGSEVGYTNGLNAADPESLTNTLVAVFQQPFDQIYRFFNFNVLGLNILGLVTGLITIFVVIKVVKKII